MNLVGASCESTLSIDGVQTTVLLDTGATVSTMIKSYYDKHFSHLPIVSLDNLINVEVAGGHSLPYEGYIQVPIIADILGLNTPVTGLLLVVDDTEYGKKVPVIIGTNILTSLNHIRGKRKIPTVWHTTFRTMTLVSRRFRRNKGRVAMLHTDKQVTIPPNGVLTFDCYLDSVIPYKGTVVIESVANSKVPSGVEILPMLEYHNGSGEYITVCVANTTNHQLTLQSRALCAQLQAVNVLPTDNAQSVPENNSDFSFNFADLSSDQTLMVNELLQKWNHVFSKSDLDIGFTDAVYHKIELLDDTPFKQRYRTIPPAMINEVKEHIQQLYDSGIIRPSNSPYASNLVLVRKKNGQLRMCIDYRQLNQRTRLDAYALPRINDIFDYLSGSKYFSVLDMKSGYHQVPVRSSDIYKTAFSAGPLGHWEFCRLPFGLTNSPATYQRLMENVFGGMYLNFVQIYLDDLIVFSSSFEDHVHHLEAVFQRLSDFNLKLAPKKCKLFQKSVKYLGHVVSENGISVDPEKTEKVSNWPTPTNVSELHCFMGFANYYRRFINGFAKIAQPLTKLLRGTNCTKKKKTVSSTWSWEVEQQEAFDQLKHCLTNAPILAFADGNLPYELHIDASRQALGAVLYQKQHGELKVIAYGSRSLSASESNYPAHKLEFLALKWAVTEKFHDYLYGAHVSIFSDSNPLTFILTSAKVDATGHRWLAALAAYSFDIKYRPGKSNSDADALSRLPCDRLEIKQNVVSSICQSQEMQPWSQALSIQCLAHDSDMSEEPLFSFVSGSFLGWKQAQRSDPGIGPLFPFVAQKMVPDRRQIPAAAVPLLRYFDKLCIINGALYRNVVINEESVRQIVLPSCYRTEVLQSLHDRMGHMGRDRTLHLVRERFFWPGMTTDVEQHITSCRRCIQRKKPVSKAPLVPISTTQPLEIVSMDHLTLEPSKGGFQHILVITDMYTRYAVAIPVRNLSASVTAKAFVDNFITHYGIPHRIHSDQGGAFESKLIQELCKLLNIDKSRTTAYHPEGNPVTERFNRSLINMLGTLEPQQKFDWKNHIAPLVHAYNCTPHAATNYSPYYLMFGRHPNLPIDVAMGIDRAISRTSSPHRYVAELRSRLLKAFNSARKFSDWSKMRQKELRDVRCRAAVLQKGDRVLVKKLAFTGKHKLADRWEPEIYIVTDQPNRDIPVYIVQIESRTGGKRCRRTLHRNHLLPIGELLSLDEDSEPVVDTADRNVELSSESSDTKSEETVDEEVAVIGEPIVDEAGRQQVMDEMVEEERRESPESETDTADEEVDEPERRYPQRERHPPDRYQAMTTQTKKLDIVHDLVKLLNKDNL